MCNGPITLNCQGAVQTVACGHCQRCAIRRSQSWTLRLLLEQSDHTCTDFVTLTYGQIPPPVETSKRHLKQFIQRCRRASGNPVRYYCCGEYGGKTGRWHWHALLFGTRFQKRGLFDTALWEHGHVFTGDLTRASAAYVSRYTLKSANPDPWQQQHIQMSRNPGIGMRKLRYIASHLAKKIPELPYYPPVLYYEGKSWWLDRHSYAASVQQYLSSGGSLIDETAPVNHLLDSASPPAYNINKIVMGWSRQWSKDYGTYRL